MMKFLKTALAAALLLFLPGVGDVVAQTTSGSYTTIGKGGTGASLTDPGADRIFFWDESAGTIGKGAFLSMPAAGLSISGTGLVLDPGIACLASLSTAADKIAYYNGTGTCALTTLTSFARTLLDDTSTAQAKATLGISLPPSVVDFGAVGNGTTDDTSAINSAITAATAGSTLYFPTLNFKITGPINVSKALTLQFDGTTITQTSAGAGFNITASNVTMVGTSGATLNGPRTPTTGNDYVATNSAVKITGTLATYLTNVRIQGLIIQNYKEAGIWTSYCSGCIYENNTIQQVSYAGIMAIADLNGKITKNTIYNVASSDGPGNSTLPTGTKTNAYGISATYGGSTVPTFAASTNTIIALNTISLVPTWSCIDTHAGNGVKITNNNLTDCRQGMSITIDSSSLDKFPQHIQVSENNITCYALAAPIYNGGASTSNGAYGLGIFGNGGGSPGNDIKVSGNSVVGCGSSETAGGTYGAVSVFDITNLSFDDNWVSAGRYRGLQLGNVVSGSFQTNGFDALVAGPVASGNIAIDVSTTSCKCYFASNWGSTTGDAYNALAAGGGFYNSIGEIGAWNGIANLFAGSSKGNFTFLEPGFDAASITNCTLTGTVSGNALTVSLKTQAGNNPTQTSPCFISFRNATAATGDFTNVAVTTTTTFVTGTTGSSFGSSSTNVPFRLWITAINNAGTVVLGVSNQSTATSTTAAKIYPLTEGTVQSSTACSACTNATAAGTIYSTAAQTSKAIRILGYMEWSSGLTTAGTWASGPTNIQLMGPGIKKPGETIQQVMATNTGTTTGAGATQTATGTTTTITPTSTVNLIQAQAVGSMASLGTWGQAQLSRGTAPGGLFGNTALAPLSTNCVCAVMGIDKPASVSSVTYTVYIVGGTTPASFTGIWNTNGQAVQTAVIILTEIQG